MPATLAGSSRNMWHWQMDRWSGEGTSPKSDTSSRSTDCRTVRLTITVLHTRSAYSSAELGLPAERTAARSRSSLRASSAKPTACW